jgi:hypothetical protein
MDIYIYIYIGENEELFKQEKPPTDMFRLASSKASSDGVSVVE